MANISSGIRSDAYYANLALRLRVDAFAWKQEGHPLDDIAKATALLETEAAQAIEWLLERTGET